MQKKKNKPQPRGGIKSWTLFLVILFSFFGLLVAGQQWLKRENQKEEPPEKTLQEDIRKGKGFALIELTEEEKKSQDEGHLQEGLKGSSLDECEKIEFDPALKDQCRDAIQFALFLKNGDPKNCESLRDPLLRQQCADQIHYNTGVEELNAEFCDKIGEPLLRQNCHDKILSVIGRSGDSATDCEKITDPTLKSQCLNQFYFSSGVKSSAPDSCQNITDPLLKDRCEKTIAQNQEITRLSQAQSVRAYQPAEDQKTICEKLGGALTECEDEAHFDLALEKKDLSYCNEIEDTQKQNECLTVQKAHINRFYLKQAISKKDPSLCQKIIDEALRGSCLNYAQ